MKHAASLTLAIALFAGTGVAYAQTAAQTSGQTTTPTTAPTAAPATAPTNAPALPSTSSAPAAVSSSANPRTTSAPVPGANSFTEGQARSRIEAKGYGHVTALKKDEKGIWRATAMKNGKSQSVSLDYQGNVVSN